MNQRMIFLFAAILSISSFGFSQSRGLGVGVEFGMPTGLSVKAWTSSSGAVQFGYGWYHTATGGSTYITGEYLWHAMHVIRSAERFPLYAGIGGVLSTGSPSTFGARGIFGMAWLSRSAPVDIFVQITPTLYFSPSSSFEFDAAAGIRYFF